MMKICAKGHITGYRNCSFCGSTATPVRGEDIQTPLRVAMDKREKKRIDQRIRDRGGIPVSDMRNTYWRIKPGKAGAGDADFAAHVGLQGLGGIL